MLAFDFNSKVVMLNQDKLAYMFTREDGQRLLILPFIKVTSHKSFTDQLKQVAKTLIDDIK